MDKLLNADVIRAAASSHLGTLSLMCLILGIIALALFRNAPARTKVSVFTLLLAGVAGFGYAVLNPPLPNALPEATRELFIGRWQVEQKIAGIEGRSYIDYWDNGKFSGGQEAFVAGRGERVAANGTWDFMKLSKDQFTLSLKFDNGTQWQGTFRVVDHDRVHNITENYDAVRVPM